MTDLSPAAQAIWTAYEEVLENECVVTKTDVKALAAALRVTADQLVPNEVEPRWWQPVRPSFSRQCIRRRLLAIAIQLENQ